MTPKEISQRLLIKVKSSPENSQVDRYGSEWSGTVSEKEFYLRISYRRDQGDVQNLVGVVCRNANWSIIKLSITAASINRIVWVALVLISIPTGILVLGPTVYYFFHGRGLLDSPNGVPLWFQAFTGLACIFIPAIFPYSHLKRRRQVVTLISELLEGTLVLSNQQDKELVQ